MKIIACGPEHFEELINFIVRLNSRDDHHIGFFGEGEADVRATLAESLIPPSEGFFLAYHGDQLAGVFGVDVNPEIGRAWLFGPLIDHTDWQSLADDLYGVCAKIIPAGIHEQDLFCDVRNLNVKLFAERQGFPLRSETAVLTLERANDKHPGNPGHPFSIVDYDPALFGQFEQLHNLLFPKTYFTAQQIVEKLDGTRRLFLALENDSLKGYHFCKVESDARLGYIDFIGVDESSRGHGLGSVLLGTGLDWMLSFPEIDQIHLTVNADNAPALKLYKNFGFVTERVMRGYRKQEIDV
ncbi:MAG: GNAT family N-acetyltransferase [Chloroflexi bacterium]|nr:GNAT family N-acetyltransferase [Chloroflexota bacterium]